jgi:hypothetical protein
MTNLIEDVNSIPLVEIEKALEILKRDNPEYIAALKAIYPEKLKKLIEEDNK